MSKVCKKCNVNKDDVEFYKHKAVCKICHNQLSKLYRESNPDVTKRNHRSSYLRNKERLRPIKNEYVRKRRKSDNLFAITDQMRRLIRSSFLKGGFNRSSRTQEIIGCSYVDFLKHIESKFESWMNWSNRGKYNGEFNYGWDIDHIIPMSSAKTEEEAIKLNHYTNLQPLCSKINRNIKRDLEIWNID